MNTARENRRSHRTAATTALLDLLACLLLSFLASDPDFLARPLRLPRWDGPLARESVEPERDRPHKVVISGPGQITWDGDVCPMHRLENRLQDAAGRNEHVLLYMDRNAPFDAFWSVYNSYWKCGFAQPPALIVHNDDATTVAHKPRHTPDVQ